MSRVSLPMKEIQTISLEILKRVTDICEENGLRYSLMYGTLIGAARHGGFIPWDDDIDIMMPRKDYNILLKILKNLDHKFHPYTVFNRELNKKYHYGITRICDIRYEIQTENEQDCGMGIFIDVYPYDGLGDDKEKALDLLEQSSNYLEHIVLATRKNLNIAKENNWKGKFVYLVKWVIHHLLGPNYYYYYRQKRLFVNLPEFDDSKYVGPLAWYFAKPEKVLFDREYFTDLVKVKFEKYEFYVPSNYHSLLTQVYGDYMTPPPIEKQVYHHHYKAYKR